MSKPQQPFPCTTIFTQGSRRMAPALAPAKPTLIEALPGSLSYRLATLAKSKGFADTTALLSHAIRSSSHSNRDKMALHLGMDDRPFYDDRTIEAVIRYCNLSERPANELRQLNATERTRYEARRLMGNDDKSAATFPTTQGNIKEMSQ